jgi:hypothetical protein
MAVKTRLAICFATRAQLRHAKVLPQCLHFNIPRASGGNRSGLWHFGAGQITDPRTAGAARVNLPSKDTGGVASLTPVIDVGDLALLRGLSAAAAEM